MIIQIGYLVPFGLLIFIFFQALLLSRRFSMAFNTVDKQRQKLIETNKAYGQEIDEHMRAKEALQESEERLKLMFDYAPDAYFLIDFDGSFLDGNKMAEKISGYNKEELIGKKFYEEDFLEPDEIQKAIDILGKSKDGSASGPKELTLKNKDGKNIEVEISVYPIKMKNHDVILGIARDVTEKIKLEGQLVQAQKMESIGTLAGGIAHDFNNLLMAIEGNAALMLLEVDPKHAHYKRLKNIEEFVQDGSGLTKQLLGFASGGKYEVRPTDINGLISKCCVMFGRTRKEIRVHEKYQEDAWPVEADHGQIEQVFLNLYVNAWQAMPNGGELYISTENIVLKDDSSKPYNAEPGKYIKASITDTGVGMDQSILHRIFDPFFTTKEMGRGTGLGLASSYGIIKNHGGFINVYSEKGEGTTFNVYLPTSEKAVAEDTDPHDTILTGSETVLFVDDEEIIIENGNNFLRT